MPEEPTHAELVQRLREGRQDAITQVYAQYVGRLIGLARHRLSERARQKVGASAVVSSAFASFVRKHADAIDLQGEHSLWDALLKITLRHCGKWNKRFRVAKRAGPEVPLQAERDPSFEPASEEPSPEEEAALNELIERVEKGMKDREREVFQFRLQDYTLAEIADKLQLSVAMVHKIMERVRGHVRKQIESQQD